MAIPTLHNDITFAQEVKDGKHNYMNVAGISKYLTKLHRYEIMLKNGMKEKDYKEECIDKQKLIWSIIEFLQSINKFLSRSDRFCKCFAVRPNYTKRVLVNSTPHNGKKCFYCVRIVLI